MGGDARELRCETRLHGILIDDRYLEFKCTSRFCGARPGVVVLHRFDLQAKGQVSTKRYRDPVREEVNSK